MKQTQKLSVPQERFKSYSVLGAHLKETKCIFRVWAPNAQSVSVVGDFNNWDTTNAIMKQGSGGVWELEIPDLSEGDLYKYALVQSDGKLSYKADPYAFFSEHKPKTASIIHNLNQYQWQDERWLTSRANKNVLSESMNIYEVHPGSFMRDDENQLLNYRDLAQKLVPHIKEMNYTHLELMPIMEHPFDGSWGYQLTGYYSVTSRYGSPEDFMFLVDTCHQNGISVILDWVPAHFCKDDHGLRMFDGTFQYEYSEHPLWGTMEFDYGKKEVLDFLISNAYFWFDIFHIDGLRIDGVASMIELNHGVDDEKNRNAYGGTDRLEAIDFLKELNTIIFRDFPFAIMAAEDSTAYPMVTWPIDKGGLGFNLKWDLGWMHDTLNYMKTDPYHRNQFHHLLTFSMAYAFNENFILPLSHDEVVHGKKTILDKMFGDYDMKFNQFRLLYAYQMTHPGKKLSFMGNEFAPFLEWRYDEPLEWFMLDYDKHRQIFEYIKALNKFYVHEKALWTIDHDWEGFKWLEADNRQQSIIVFSRNTSDPADSLIVLINFCPIAYEEYRIGVPDAGSYRLAFNSDDTLFGGTGQKVKKTMKSTATAFHGQDQSITVTVPPSSMVVFKKVQHRKKKSSKK
ncbi:1,4-alpha-glucan branching protein GlgB [Eubacteriaceae bacterium ES3]|nr:1,4-alpha-glucan branching protein GlgB [Eubacteriaceae bacterium ES3]